VEKVAWAALSLELKNCLWTLTNPGGRCFWLNKNQFLKQAIVLKLLIYIKEIGWLSWKESAIKDVVKYTYFPTTYL